MNELTTLFVDYLQHRKSACDAAEAWVSELDDCDESPEGTKAATFRYMSVIHQEFLVFVSGADLAAAAIALQE